MLLTTRSTALEMPALSHQQRHLTSSLVVLAPEHEMITWVSVAARTRVALALRPEYVHTTNKE